VEQRMHRGVSSIRWHELAHQSADTPL
jgi:hypothetical protein